MREYSVPHSDPNILCFELAPLSLHPPKLILSTHTVNAPHVQLGSSGIQHLEEHLNVKAVWIKT